MNQQEKNMVALIREGDRTIFRRLYDLYYTRLFLYAKSYIEDTNEAEDIIQELFLDLWKKREDLDILTSLSSYMFRAVHNRCIQYLRHQKVIEGFESMHQLKMRDAEILYNSSADFSFTEVQFKEIEQIYNQTSKLLPEKTMEIFGLSRTSFKSNKEIATLLNIDLKTVEYHITKALRLFHSALKDYFILIFALWFVS
jgi:RNA polymerase sigma-70 factor, ECF subfamily